jgi:hypothetical protein
MIVPLLGMGISDASQYGQVGAPAAHRNSLNSAVFLSGDTIGVITQTDLRPDEWAIDFESGTSTLIVWDVYPF